MSLCCYSVCILVASCFILGNLPGSSVADDFATHIDRTDWVDPTDMTGYDTETKKNIQPISESKSKDPKNEETITEQVMECNCKELGDNIQKCHTNLENCHHEMQSSLPVKHERMNTDAIYFKQYINTLLNKFSEQANLDLGDEETIRFVVEILLKKEDINTLKRVGVSKGSAGITDAHSVLVNSILSVEESVVEKLTFAEKWKLTFILENVDIILKILSGFLLAYAVMKIHASLNMSITSLLIKLCVALFIISLPLTWWKLYQEASAERQVAALQGMPESCNPKDYTVQKSIFESLKSIFTFDSDECANYYKKMTVDPFTEVPPTKVLAVTVTTFILEPVEHIGIAISKFIRAVFEPLPYHMQPIVAIVMIFFFLLTTLMIFGYKLNLFYFFGIEPSHNSKDVKRIKDLEKKVEALQEGAKRENTSESIKASQPEQVGALSFTPQTQMHPDGGGDSQHVTMKNIEPIFGKKEERKRENKSEKDSVCAHSVGPQTQVSVKASATAQFDIGSGDSKHVNMSCKTETVSEEGHRVEQCSDGKKNSIVSAKDSVLQPTSIGPTS